MAELIKMPKMSDTMQEGVIAKWLKKVGDAIKSGDILAEIETDKATLELEAYDDGTLLYIAEGDRNTVPVDGVIAIIGDKDENIDELIDSIDKQQPKTPESDPDDGLNQKLTTDFTEELDIITPSVVEAKQQASKTSKSQSVKGGFTDDLRIKASPLAKKLAVDMGYDISKISGSGENGRIVKKDIEGYNPEYDQQKSEQSQFNIPLVAGEEQYEDIPLSQMRKTIARRLQDSKFTAPHFYLTMEINMDKAVEARASMNEMALVKISYNDLVIKATAASLRRHPDVNVSWLGDKIRRNSHIHIGVAVAIEDGLVVPVIRFADNKPLSVISAEVKQISEKAKNKQLQPQDWEGNTFTISNLGMFGIEEFTAIINPPDSCILAIGGIRETPIVKNGQIVAGHLMKVTLSCDHRAVDGATGAAFLKTLKELLEDPVRILI